MHGRRRRRRRRPDQKSADAENSSICVVCMGERLFFLIIKMLCL